MVSCFFLCPDTDCSRINLLIEIPVAKEMIKPEEDGSFVRCIDENVLSEKLQEWHVELEGDELGRPPWKKIF